MSYLLQTGRGTNKKSTVFGSSSSNHIALPRSGRHGGGGFRRTSGGVGGQVQTVRPPQHKQMLAPPCHVQQMHQNPQQSQQAQRNVDSVLSMEEGM